MAEKTKAKFEAKTDDEKYLHAEKLLKAIDCLTRDKERAEIYEYVANIYKGLGEYKDAKEKYEECDKKAKEHKKLAAEHKDTNPKVEDDEKKSSGIVGKIILAIIGILVIAVIALFVYTRTTPGKYARASYYQKTGNYQKAYKMFRTLGGYKDSEAKLAKTELGVIKKAKVILPKQNKKKLEKNFNGYENLFLCQMISKMAMPKNIMTPFLVIFLKPMF